MSGMFPNPSGAAFIKPTAGVTISSQSPMQQATMGNPGMPIANADPYALFKSLSSPNQRLGGFDWNNADPKIGQLSAWGAEIIGDSSVQQDEALKAHVVMVVSQIIQAFMQDVNTGRMTNGSKYLNFLRGLKAFGLTQQNIPCPTRAKFVEFAEKNRGFQSRIAGLAGVMAGYQIVELCLKATQPNQEQTFAIIETAVINTCFMEMVIWMNRTNDGKLAYQQITPELRNLLNDLPKFIGYYNEAFMSFTGNASPYDGLRLEASEIQAHLVQMQSQYEYQSYKNPGIDDENLADLRALAMRNAAKFHGTWIEPVHEMQFNRTHTTFGDNPDNRIDLENITVKNRHQFRVDTLMKEIGNTGWFVIEEEVWQHVKRAYRKHQEQRQEISVMPGFFRIVNIDIQRDTGWKSDSIKGVSLSMARVMSNPELLLPLLEQRGEEIKTIYNKSLGDFFDKDEEKDRYLIKHNKIKELDVSTLVSTEELIVSDSSQNIESIVDITSKTTQPQTGELFAVSFPVVTFRTIDLDDATVAEELHARLPMLVIGHNPVKYDSYRGYLKNVKSILDNYFEHETQVHDWVTTWLTTSFNRWLVEKRGFPADKTDPMHLSVSNVFEEIEKVWMLFKDYDVPTFNALLEGPALNELMQRSAFIPNPKVRERITKVSNRAEGGLSVFETKASDKLMHITREMHVLRIANHPTPNWQGSKELIVKKSSFPELFHLVKQVRNKDHELLSGDCPDVVLSFKEDDSLWLFNLSGYDENVAVLRQISRRTQLVNMALE